VSCLLNDRKIIGLCLGCNLKDTENVDLLVWMGVMSQWKRLKKRTQPRN
jgi:hypothetical protein